MLPTRERLATRRDLGIVRVESVHLTPVQPKVVPIITDQEPTPRESIDLATALARINFQGVDR